MVVWASRVRENVAHANPHSTDSEITEPRDHRDEDHAEHSLQGKLKERGVHHRECFKRREGRYSSRSWDRRTHVSPNKSETTSNRCGRSQLARVFFGSSPAEG